jgi:hypothetical protein
MTDHAGAIVGRVADALQSASRATPRDLAERQAGAVVEALGLRSERRTFDAMFGERQRPQRRYVTHWEQEREENGDAHR